MDSNIPVKTAKCKILFITQWQFYDALVETYTLPNIRIIEKLKPCYPYLITINNTIYKLRIKKRKDIVSIDLPSPQRYLFTGWILNLFTIIKIIRKKNIYLFHTWCTPAGVIGVLLKLLYRKSIFVLDSFEPHAETMVENGTWSKYGFKFRFLFYFEKLEPRLADYIIFAARGMENYVLEKYKFKVNKFFVKPACINFDEFHPGLLKDKEMLSKYGLENKIVGIYAGKFGGMYLEDEVFDFISHCEKYWGNNSFRFLLLSNIADEYLNNKMKKYSLNRQTILKFFVPHEQVPSYLGLADFALSPYKPVPSKKYSTPIKNGEYWAMGLPVIITPGISEDSEIIINNKAGALIESFNDWGYKNAIKQIDYILKSKNRVEIYSKIRPLAEKYRNYKISENVYKNIYNYSLLMLPVP